MYLTVSGQTYEYGNVTKELLELKTCPIDTEANAMITYKSGTRVNEFFKERGFVTNFVEKKQIKIFTNEAKNLGTVNFFYYSPKNSSGVKLSGIKGTTYTLENNKIVKTKLSDENIFEEQVNNYIKKVSIAIPKIVNGCVFEYEYSKSSNYISNIEDWEVQEEIPVLYNEFITELPENFVFQTNLIGPIVPISDDQRNEFRNVYLCINGKNCISNFNFIIRKLKFENIAAFKPEPFTASKKEGQGIITNQLTNINFPGGTYKEFATSYKQFTEKLLDDSRFGKITQNGSFIKKMVSIDPSTSKFESANQIYSHFQYNLTTNFKNGYYSDKSGKNLFKDGFGNMADINLNYIAALNEMGIKTYAVLLSTRGNGIPHPVFPNYSKFNAVIALSYIDNELYFSDPSSDLPFGYLPTECLNNNGWIVSENEGQWIPMKQYFIGKQIVMNNIRIEGDALQYNNTIKKEDYLAFDDLEIINKKTKETLLNSIHAESEIRVDSIVMSNVSPKEIKYQAYLRKKIDDGNYFLVKPFTNLPFDGKQPFKAEKRTTVVDFPYLKEYKYICNIKLPEGFVSETPKDIYIVSENKELIFKYQTSLNEVNNTLNVVADFKIGKTEFMPEEYPDFKSFMETALNKLHENVIVKKQ